MYYYRQRKKNLLNVGHKENSLSQPDPNSYLKNDNDKRNKKQRKRLAEIYTLIDIEKVRDIIYIARESKIYIYRYMNRDIWIN